MYVESRYLNTDVGRFIGVDPVFLGVGSEHAQEWLTNPQVHNAYSYAGNNPVKYIDPDGEFMKSFAALPYCKPVVRAGLSAIGHVGSRMLNTPLANNMWQHSLQDNPPTWTNADYPDVENIIKGSEEYQSVLSNQKISGELLSGIVFNEGDLGFGVHRADLSFETQRLVGEKNGMTVRMSDTFDFKWSGGAVGWIGDTTETINNMAAIAQKVGVVNSFDVDITTKEVLE